MQDLGHTCAKGGKGVCYQMQCFAQVNSYSGGNKVIKWQKRFPPTASSHYPHISLLDRSIGIFVQHRRVSKWWRWLTWCRNGADPMAKPALPPSIPPHSVWQSDKSPSPPLTEQRPSSSVLSQSENSGTVFPIEGSLVQSNLETSFSPYSMLEASSSSCCSDKCSTAVTDFFAVDDQFKVARSVAEQWESKMMIMWTARVDSVCVVFSLLIWQLFLIFDSSAD